MFDSHLHLATDEVLAAARAVGVNGFLLAGVEPTGWAEQKDIAHRHPDVLASVGIHPQVVDASTTIDTLAAALDGAVAIGEIGLDALTPERRALLPFQREVFRAQLALARERDLPVLLHILRTHEDALKILREDGLPKAGGVVHSYSGSVDLLDRYLPLGLHIALGASVTFHNATRSLAIAAAIPRDRLLIETDAPPNTPAFLPSVCAAVARCRNETVDEVARFTEENARRLLKVN